MTDILIRLANKRRRVAAVAILGTLLTLSGCDYVTYGDGTGPHPQCLPSQTGRNYCDRH